jgi:hypothetical protein
MTYIITANNITLVEEEAIFTPVHVIDMEKTLRICKDINSSRNQSIHRHARIASNNTMVKLT